MIAFGVIFIIAVVLGFVYILAKVPEKSTLLTGLGSASVFVIALFFTVLIPSFNTNWSSATSEHQERFHQPYTPQQLRGRLIYQREGCMYCHSQQIRPLKNEMARYSIGASLAVPADEREYVYDQPHFLGTRRIGPDLSREGGKYSDDWHYSHFYNPRQMVPGSIMPAFTWLFTTAPDDVTRSNPVPSQDARDLVAYVQTLGFGRLIYDPATYKTNGGWGPWLRPRDQQYSQNVGLGQVVRAEKPIITQGDKTPANAVATPPVQKP